MSIASAIQTKQQQIAAAYTACDSKGATMPATEDLTNLATCINSISGGGGSTKWNITIDDLIGDANELGELQNPSSSYSVILPNTVTSLSIESIMQFKFASSGIVNADLSSLTSVSGKKALHYTCQNATNLKNMYLSGLTTVSGESAIDYICDGCTALEYFDVNSLVSITGKTAFQYALSRTSLKTLFFLNLCRIAGQQALQNLCFQNTAIEDIYFCGDFTQPGYGISSTTALQNLLSNTGTNKTHTLHFRDGMQSIVSGLTGYPNFGGTSGYVNISYDLGDYQHNKVTVFRLIGDTQKLYSLEVYLEGIKYVYHIEDFKNNYLVLNWHKEAYGEWTCRTQQGVSSGYTPQDTANHMITIDLDAVS